MSLEETLRRIERKLEAIEAEMREMKQWIIRNNLTETSLIELPDHLRKTAMGLLKIRQGTAGEVSKYTKRTRAVESGYLNQLERQGLVTSSKEGRRKVFALHSDFAVRSPFRDHQ
jgi:predicted transcriptional regulator